MAERSSEQSQTAQPQQQSQQRRSQYYHQQSQQRYYNGRQNQNAYYNEQQQQQHRRFSNQRNNNKQKDFSIQDEDEANSNVKKVKAAESSAKLKQQISTASTASDLFSQSSKNCICCLHSLTTYVTYSCFHYICLHCAVKLRIICEKFECPICRQPSDSVICSKDTIATDEIKDTSVENTKFLLILNVYKKQEPLKGGFYYDLDRVRHEYDELLSHRCKLCKGSQAVSFSELAELEHHIKRAHQMNYCELCSANLRLFTFERKFYTRQDLVRHRREGDVDDQSFKGHPNCVFCDERFFDKDELYRHYRKEHFYCHFCDADGHEEYYDDYPELRKHFKDKHYLCEIDECGMKAGSHDYNEYAVFRSDIDYNAHKRLKHAKSKSEAKNLGRINIEFNVSNPIRDRIRDRNNRGETAPAAASTISDERSHGSNSSRSGDGGGGGGERGEPRSKHRERNKQQQQANLRDLYEKFAETNEPAPVVVEKQEQPVPAPVSPPVITSTIISEPVEAPAAVALPATWRNLISSGPVPRMNLEAEFPSLSNGQMSSLASIGAAIAKTSTGAWSQKAASVETKQTETKSKKTGKSKVAIAPVLSAAPTNPLRNALSSTLNEADEQMVSLKTLLQKPERDTRGETFTVLNKKLDDEEDEEVKTRKKDKKGKNKKNKIEIDFPIDEPSSSPPKALAPTPVATASALKSPPGFSKPTEQATSIEEQLQKQINSFSQVAIASNKNPPPGFSQQAAAAAVPAPADVPKHTPYVKPQNYDHRNNELTLKLISLLDGAQFNLFKSASMDYHTQKLNAKAYMEKCKSIFSNDADKYKQFLDLLQDMIILLPDIHLQNQLYDEYLTLVHHNQQHQQQQESKKTKLAWAEKSQSKTPTVNNNNTNILINCVNCNQLLGHNELAVHLSKAHSSAQKNDLTTTTTNSEFPDLPSSSSVIFNNPQESLSLLNKKKGRYYRKL